MQEGGEKKGVPSMKGLATFRCAAVFLAAAAAALLVSGADIVSTACPPPASADTERCVHR